ncbi:MAG: pyruvate kinase, partial [Candidatus Thorarchaeota archaeon]
MTWEVSTEIYAIPLGHENSFYAMLQEEKCYLGGNESDKHCGVDEMTEKSTRTKIVCTIGPASRAKETLAKMIEAGMDVARLNLSHDTHSTHRKTFDAIRSLDSTIPILFDIQGPKTRIGKMKEPAKLVTGAEFVISTKDFVGDSSRVSISHKELPDDIKPGDTIAINDGIVRLRVTDVDGT